MNCLETYILFIYFKIIHNLWILKFIICKFPYKTCVFSCFPLWCILQFIFFGEENLCIYNLLFLIFVLVILEYPTMSFDHIQSSNTSYIPFFQTSLLFSLFLLYSEGIDTDLQYDQTFRRWTFFKQTLCLFSKHLSDDRSISPWGGSPCPLTLSSLEFYLSWAFSCLIYAIPIPWAHMYSCHVVWKKHGFLIVIYHVFSFTIYYCSALNELCTF